MKKRNPTIKAVFYVIFLLLSPLPLVTYADHPPLVATSSVVVDDPEQPKAYYGRLQGMPHSYRVEATESFDLKLTLLIPDLPDEKRDIMAAVLAEGSDEAIAILDGSTFSWGESSETISGSPYLEGPSLDKKIDPGIYEVRVWSSNNDSSYAILFGEREETNAYPSPLCFFLSFVIIGLIIAAIIWGIRRRRVVVVEDNIPPPPTIGTIPPNPSARSSETSITTTAVPSPAPTTPASPAPITTPGAAPIPPQKTGEQKPPLKETLEGGARNPDFK